MERLSREVWPAFESTPPGGMEIGGLLLGEADSQALLIEIRDFDALLCEDRPDHRFVLSDSERRALKKMLATRRSMHDGELQVVGCYRSQIGEGLTLSEGDFSLARACLGDSFGVFLLIQPASNGDLNAGFFFWDNGQIDSAYTCHKFPFDTRRLAAALVPASSHEALSHLESDAKRIDEPPPAEPEKERHTLQTLLGQTPLLAGRMGSIFERASSALVARASAWRGRRFHLLWQSLLAVLAVALSVAAYRAYRNRTPAVVAADAAGLALQVERRERDLRVSWDRDAQAVRHASKAVLSIRDGDSPPRELQLDVEQLRNGGTVYSPISARVQFRLEVAETDNTKTTETILTVLAPQQNLIEASVEETRQRDGASARGRTRLEHPAPFAPKRAATARSRATMQASGAVAGQVGSIAASAAAFVAARPIRETRANLTASIRSTITSPVEVQVKVRIDESGRVVRADPVALTGPASNALVAATQNAALLWTFAPATRGNQPIASDVVLKFSYRP
ncbi:MAG TPA: hypothetical protein VEU11_10100 [Terriglobales bacterium]|nr:hypothetical protein [Terriglobales bacterium]